MNPNDFVYNAVFKGCIKEGVNNFYAKEQAVKALGLYKTNRFTKASKLIDDSIKEAKKNYKKFKDEKKC